MSENKRYTFLANDRLQEMIEDIKNEQGWKTDTQAITSAIIDKYTKLFPTYSSGPRRRKDTEQEELVVPEKKLSREEKKAIRDAEREEEMFGLCHELEGEVFEKDGMKMCRFYKYSRKKKYETVLPITALNHETKDTQYYPDKATVIKLINKEDEGQESET